MNSCPIESFTLTTETVVNLSPALMTAARKAAKKIKSYTEIDRAGVESVIIEELKAALMPKPIRFEHRADSP